MDLKEENGGHVAQETVIWWPLQTIIESTRGGKREAVNQLSRMKCLYRSVTSCWTEGMCHML